MASLSKKCFRERSWDEFSHSHIGLLCARSLSLAKERGQIEALSHEEKLIKSLNQ